MLERMFFPWLRRSRTGHQTEVLGRALPLQTRTGPGLPLSLAQPPPPPPWNVMNRPHPQSFED